MVWYLFIGGLLLDTTIMEIIMLHLLLYVNFGMSSGRLCICYYLVLLSADRTSSYGGAVQYCAAVTGGEGEGEGK